MTAIREQFAEGILNAELLRQNRSGTLRLRTEKNATRAEEMQLAAKEFADKKFENVILRLQRMISDCDLDSPSLPVVRHALGIALMESGNLSRARRELLTAMSLLRSAPPEPLGSDIIDDLGMVYLYQGKLGASTRAHRRALTRNLYLRDQRRVARTCEHLGLVAWKQGETSAALGWLLTSLSLRCPLGLAADLADSMDSLGRVCSSLKYHLIALEFHRHALKHRSAVGDEPATAKTLTNLGVACRRMGKLSIAISYHQRAMKIRRHYNDKVGMANSHNNLGYVLLKMRRFRSARKQVRKAFRLRYEMGDEVNMFRNLFNLRNIEMSLDARASLSRTFQ